MEGAPPVANQIDLFMHFWGASRDGLVARRVDLDTISSSEEGLLTYMHETMSLIWVQWRDKPFGAILARKGYFYMWLFGNSQSLLRAVLQALLGSKILFLIYCLLQEEGLLTRMHETMSLTWVQGASNIPYLNAVRAQILTFKYMVVIHHANTVNRVEKS
jgi:hypothetical protein